jgi:hypothetical protein
MIAVVTEEMHGSDEIPDQKDYGVLWLGMALVRLEQKWRSRAHALLRPKYLTTPPLLETPVSDS